MTASPDTTPIVYNAAHAAEGVAHLIEFFRDKPRLESMIEAFAGEIQEIEVALWALLTERSVDVAVGVQLDVLGEIVGQPRGDQIDADYRVWLQARIRVNRSSGRINDLRDTIEILLGTTAGQYVIESYYAATVVVDVVPALAYDPAILSRLLQDATAAGVRTILQASTVAPSLRFQLAPGSTIVSGSANGFDAGKLNGSYES